MHKEDKIYTVQNMTNGAKVPEATEEDFVPNLGQVNSLIADVNTAIDALALALGSKVDVVAGKSLSTNDFNTTYKSKLDGINVDALVKLDPLTAQAGNTNITGTSKASIFQLSDILSVEKPTNGAIVVVDYNLIAGRYYRFNIDGTPVGEIRTDGFRHPTEGYAVYEDTPNPLLKALSVNKLTFRIVPGAPTSSSYGFLVYDDISKEPRIIPTSALGPYIQAEMAADNTIAKVETNVVWGAGATTHDIIDSGTYTFIDNVEHTVKLPVVAGNTKKKFTFINQGSSGAKIILNTNLGGNQIWNAGTLVSTIDINVGEVLTVYNNSLNYSIL